MAGRDGLPFSAVAIVPGIATLWLGRPFVLAGSGVALGLIAWRTEQRRRGAAAIALGALMLGLGTATNFVQAIDKLG